MKELKEAFKDIFRDIKRELVQIAPYVLVALVLAIPTAYLMFYLPGASSYSDTTINPDLRMYGAEEGRIRFMLTGIFILTTLFSAALYPVHQWWRRWRKNHHR